MAGCVWRRSSSWVYTFRQLRFPYVQGSAEENAQGLGSGTGVGGEVGTDPGLLSQWWGQSWTAKPCLSKWGKLDLEKEVETRTRRGEGNQYNYLTSCLLNWSKHWRWRRVVQAGADQKIRNILAMVLEKGICSLEILCSENIIRFVYRHKRRLFLYLSPSLLLSISGCNLKFKRREETKVRFWCAWEYLF